MPKSNFTNETYKTEHAKEEQKHKYKNLKSENQKPAKISTLRNVTQ